MRGTLGKRWKLKRPRANIRSANARFWEKVRKTATCWLWTAARRNGYGLFFVHGSRPKIYAHRYVLELAGRVIPDGKQIDHLCRTPLCVNPEHLEVVTREENLRRGNKAEGERIGVAKLTEQLVREMRQRRNNGESLTKIAQSVGVSNGTASVAIRGITWDHVT